MQIYVMMYTNCIQRRQICMLHYTNCMIKFQIYVYNLVYKIIIQFGHQFTIILTTI
jgi:hypothetical protein